jgi:hypothetical protein
MTFLEGAEPSSTGKYGSICNGEASNTLNELSSYSYRYSASTQPAWTIKPY